MEASTRPDADHRCGRDFLSASAIRWVRVLRNARSIGLWGASFAILALGTTIAQSASTQELGVGSNGSGASATEDVDALGSLSIEARLVAVRDEITNAEAGLRIAEPGKSQHLQHVVNRLRQIEALLEDQAELAKPSPPSESDRPASIDAAPSVFALHGLMDAQSGLGSPDDLSVRREALANAKDKLELADRSRRKARREWEQAEGAAKSAAEERFELRRLDARIADERVRLRTLETRVSQHARDARASDADRATAIDRMRAQLARGEGDSSSGFAELTALEGALRRTRESTERRLAKVELRLDASEQRFSRLADPSAELLEEIELLTAHRDAVRQEIAVVDARIERLANQRQVWRQWDELLRGVGSKEEFPAWIAAAEDRIERLKDDEVRRRGRVSDLEERLLRVDERLTDIGPTSGLRPMLEEHRDALRRLEQAQRTEARALAADQLLTERFLHDIRGQETLSKPLESIARSLQSVGTFWDYEITTIDDEPITVGSLALALILFGIGLWAARRGSEIAGRVARTRFKLDEGGANALQTLSFYLLLVSFMLMALRAVHFPLTAFTVLGGAAAIGIGFGSQNVMNNFISGLILMLERPVRARDVVEVDGNHGTIETIGARSTQIRSTDGRHIVVPNSFFLESNVVNWTLSDDLIRGKVSVGVVYGSPTRLVEELIRRVVDEEPAVLKTPPPIILFDGFGDNSLNFDVYFWVRARSPMDVKKVQSLMRFRIDDLFREHDLVIAFPQRDVHLDSVSPIEVRVVDDIEATDSDTR